MFKNRALQVKMVKDEKDPIPEIDSTELFIENAATIGVFAKDIVTTVGKVAIGVITADTIRQVIVAKASK